MVKLVKRYSLMKTLLIGINSKYIHPAIGVHQIYTNAESDVSYHEFTIKDNNQTIIDYITNESFDVLGFSVYIWNVEKIKQIIETLEGTQYTIVLGGPEASYHWQPFSNFKNVCYIIKGEGEIPFNLLIAYLKNKIDFTQVYNVIYRQNNMFLQTPIKVFPLDSIKHDYSLIQDFKNKVSYIEASRGCFFNCAYCLASLEKPVRFFNIETVKQEIIFLLKEKAKIIKFLDRSFNINTKYMLEILLLIKENDNGYTTFQFEIVGDLLTEEAICLINSMRKGYIRLEIGIQTTNEITTAAILRKQNFTILKQNILNLRDNTTIHTDLIAGLPYENLESFKKSFNDVFLLFSDELQLGFLKELQETHISNTKKQHGYTFDKTSPYEVVANNYITKEELDIIRLVEKGVNKFYNSHNFTRLMAYLFQTLNLNPFDTFYKIMAYISKTPNFHQLQFDEITKLFYQSLFEIVPDIEKLLFIIKQDYLAKSKMRPKIWWQATITKLERNYLYQRFVETYSNLTLDILYRYGQLEKNKNEYFLVNYQNNSIYYIDSCLAFCGFDCALCPLYKKDLPISCPGCTTSQTEMCQTCNIRVCNLNKKINSCSVCLDYPCDKINVLSPMSIKTLNLLNKNHFKKG